MSIDTPSSTHLNCRIFEDRFIWLWFTLFPPSSYSLLWTSYSTLPSTFRAHSTGEKSDISAYHFWHKSRSTYIWSLVDQVLNHGLEFELAYEHWALFLFIIANTKFYAPCFDKRGACFSIRLYWDFPLNPWLHYNGAFNIFEISGLLKCKKKESKRQLGMHSLFPSTFFDKINYRNID